VIEPDDDPIERLNILVALDDMDDLLRQVRVAVLARSAMYGQVCLRDVDIALGELSPRPGEEAIKPATIEAIFHAADFSGLETLADVMEQAVARLDHIETLLGERLTGGWTLGVEKLPATLRHAAKVVREHLSRHPGNAMASVTPSDGAFAASIVDGAQATAGLNGEVASRVDVARQIDHICEYYALVEPGSPVPILLQRAKRLINMTFIELMSELSPQGLAEISFLVGHRPAATHADDGMAEAF
jgi:type VI secretion system protein ImpA